MSEIIKFPSIEQFRNVRRNVEWRAQYQGQDENDEPIMNRLAKLPTLKFLGLEKLHGSNCSLIIENQQVTCQSRERIITPEDDNYGFARFIEMNKELILKSFPDNVVIYGEWAGKGIQNKVGICKLEKLWAIFAAKSLETDEWIDIKGLKTPENIRIYNLYQHNITWNVEINFENPAEDINKLNELTLEVEKRSPFAAQFLPDDENLVGEGIVWKCVEPGWESSKFWYKVKGSEHSGSKVTKLANVDVEKLKSVEEFVVKVVEEGRLSQGLNYLKENNLFDYERSMGAFLSWIANDILKEEFDLMEASNLSKKDIGSAVAKSAKRWYFEKIQNV